MREGEKGSKRERELGEGLRAEAPGPGWLTGMAVRVVRLRVTYTLHTNKQ
jgi:hypothetical protein